MYQILNNQKFSCWENACYDIKSVQEISKRYLWGVKTVFNPLQACLCLESRYFSVHHTLCQEKKNKHALANFRPIKKISREMGYIVNKY